MAEIHDDNDEPSLEKFDAHADVCEECDQGRICDEGKDLLRAAGISEIRTVEMCSNYLIEYTTDTSLPRVWHELESFTPTIHNGWLRLELPEVEEEWTQLRARIDIAPFDIDWLKESTTEEVFLHAGLELQDDELIAEAMQPAAGERPKGVARDFSGAMDAALAKIEGLLDLEPGWDGKQAEPPHFPAIQRILELFSELKRLGEEILATTPVPWALSIVPSITPLDDGSINLIWKDEGLFISITFSPLDELDIDLDIVVDEGRGRVKSQTIVPSSWLDEISKASVFHFHTFSSLLGNLPWGGPSPMPALNRKTGWGGEEGEA